MKKRKTYLRLTVIMSVLFGIILPLVLGIKNPTLIAITFSSMWFIYIVILMIMVFLVKPGLKIKVIRHKNPTIVRFELSGSTK
jgi:ABC-type transport system involved in Fe-S cluster assembly fused permease/ATPase subunit